SSTATGGPAAGWRGIRRPRCRGWTLPPARWGRESGSVSGWRWPRDCTGMAGAGASTTARGRLPLSGGLWAAGGLAGGRAGERAITVSGLKPEGSLEEEKAPQSVRDEGATFPTYSLGDKVAARRAFGDALVALQSRPDVVVMDAEVGNSTYTEAFAKVRPER